jgi:sortase (surface protein transpeptidase)
LETLGLLPDGRLAPPRDPDRAGWWRGGSRPGERGRAVIAGHVDSRTGPAVFARLLRLRRGDRIVVVDTAGRRVTFTVRATEEHPKHAFPTQRVYGASRRAALRLITCSGIFDRASGHYESNFVVFADKGEGRDQ